MSAEIFHSWDGKPVYGLVGALVLVSLLAWNSSRRALPTPPGPRKFPIVGNILSMPMSRHWEIIRDWEKEYGKASLQMLILCFSDHRALGELIYLEGFGQKILAVNSYALSQTLLSTRAANYSDRGFGPLVEM
jgi:hypothetical protein